MTDSLREYIYISARKLDALSHALDESTLKRVRELNVKVGPVGAGIGFADAAPRTKHRALVEIERAIRESRAVKNPDAPLLNAGDWVATDDAMLAYGSPTDVWDGGAAVFVTSIGKTDLVLCGSAEHLLDRKAPTGKVVPSMSAPWEIGLLLNQADPSKDLAKSRQRMPMAGGSANSPYAFWNLREALIKFAPTQPATFLARVTHVYPWEDIDGEQRRVVAGTPLYVALALGIGPAGRLRRFGSFRRTGP